jgi:hypothetical protein
MRSALLAALPLLLAVPAVAAAQSRYPARPTVLPDSEEIALAMSAAPPVISGHATIYTVRNGQAVVLRQGTNGAACMVARDLHPGSSYPICFDAEGARTRLWRELMELRLRMAGDPEPEIRRKVDAALRDGSLRMPAAMSVTYMMSPRQVLFSSPDSTGRRVGAWWPHLMIMGPGLSRANLGIPDSAAVMAAFQVGDVAGNHGDELIVKLPFWSDGTPVRR